jgi:Trk K+ transport system NAD-binding subunit
MIFNPNPETEINPSDIMVVLGNDQDIKDLEKEL